jgi:hypothetical protein
MNSKPHRQNSDFQLKYFLAGSCHTPDGAYVLLYGQKVDMAGKLAHADSQVKRRLAKIAKAQHIMDNPRSLPHEVLEAEADKLEVEADIPTWELNFKAAQQELATIERLMAELKPQCKYWDDDILVMSEAMQVDEWRGELMRRAENFMLTAGTIPHDHFDTMRMHPQFKSHLVPHIMQLQNKIEDATKRLAHTGQLADPDGMTKLMLALEDAPLLLTSEG